MRSLTLDGLICASLTLFSFFVLSSVTAAEAFLILTIILLLLKRRQSHELRALGPELKANPLLIPWLVYLGVCLLTAAAAYYPAKGLGQFNSDLLKYICLSTLFLTVTRERLPWLSRSYAAAASVSAVVGIGQVLKIFPINRPPQEMRAGAFMSPVRFGEVMAIALAFLFCKLLFHDRNSRKENVFYAAAGLLVSTAFILSQTRGAYLGFFIFLALFLFFPAGRRLKALGLSALLLGFGFLTAAGVNPAVRSRFTILQKPAAAAPAPGAVAGKLVLEESAGMRFEFWKLGAEMFLAHPVLGIGPDNIKPMFTAFRPGLLFGAKWGTLHNLYVQQAAERGLLGLGALLFLFFAFFRFALDKFRAVPGTHTLWALCVLPAFYAMNISEISFQHVHTSFAIFMALAFSSAEREGS